MDYNLDCHISIYSTDNEEQRISMDKIPPTVDNIMIGKLLLEDRAYRVEVIVNHKDLLIEEIELFINDLKVPFQMNYDTEEHRTKYTFDYNFYFSGCFDLTTFTVLGKQDNGVEHYFYSPYLHVATNKLVIANVEKMLEEIEMMNEDSLESCFSKCIKASGMVRDKSKGIASVINFLCDILKSFRRNYLQFKNKPRVVVFKTLSEVDTSKASRLSSEGIYSILIHPENLKRVDYKTDIKVGREYFYPEKVMSIVEVNTLNTYENSVIISFLRSLTNYVKKLTTSFESLLFLFNAKEFETIETIPEGYDIPIKSIRISIRHFYKKTLEQLYSIQQSINNLYFQYKNIFDFPVNEIKERPRLTQTFRSVPHYREAFDMIIRWYNYGDYDLSSSSYLFRLKTLDKIYEYYCLLKLLHAAYSIGYSLDESTLFNYHDDTESLIGEPKLPQELYSKTLINNTYKLSNAETGCNLTIYYEPRIYSFSSSNGISLYRVDGRSLYKPDFVMKFQYNDSAKEYYSILDAKFSYFTKVRDIALPELSFKYLIKLGQKGCLTANIISLWLLYPITRGFKRWYLKNSEMSKSNLSYPIIGLFSLYPDSDLKYINELILEAHTVRLLE